MQTFSNPVRAGLLRRRRFERTLDNAIDSIFIATEPIIDRVMLYQYDALNRPITTTLNPTHGHSDLALNRVSVTADYPTSGHV